MICFYDKRHIHFKAFSTPFSQGRWYIIFTVNVLLQFCFQILPTVMRFEDKDGQHSLQTTDMTLAIRRFSSIFLSETPFSVFPHWGRGSILITAALFVLPYKDVFFSPVCPAAAVVVTGPVCATGETQPFTWVTKGPWEEQLIVCFTVKNWCIKERQNASCWSRESGSSKGQHEALFCSSV